MPGHDTHGQSFRGHGQGAGSVHETNSVAPLLAEPHPVNNPCAQKRPLDNESPGLIFPVVKRRLSTKCPPTKGTFENIVANFSAYELSGTKSDIASCSPFCVNAASVLHPIETKDFAIVAVDMLHPFDDSAKRASEAVQSAHQIFDELWEDFMIGSGGASPEEILEWQVQERYDTICDAFVNLMMETGHDAMPKVELEDRAYDVVQFSGISESFVDSADTSAIQVCARKALCGLLAVLASRAEKCWLSASFDQELEQRRRARPRENARDAFRAVLASHAQRGTRGSFAHALQCPTSNFRVGLTRDGPWPRPASLILTRRLPLRDALALLDEEGPITEPQAKLRRCEFALQKVLNDESAESSQEQELAHLVRAEPALKELLCSERPVIFVEAAAALVPRERSDESVLCEVVESEVLAVLREAKAQGHAVIFAVGSIHGSAREAPIQPSLATYGLRCGHFRWRDCKDPLVSGSQAWAQDKRGGRRACIGLQLP